jgi:hypothetical protein
MIMFARRCCTAFIAFALSSVCALAQTAVSGCDTLLTKGLRDYNISSESTSSLNNIFNQYCYADGRANTSAFNAGLSAIIYSVPISLTLGSTDASQATTNFCKTYKGSSFYNNNVDTYQEKIVQRAYDSYDACVRLQSEGFYVTHDLLTSDKAQILLRAGVGKPIEVDGLDSTSNITCVGPDGTGTGNKINYSVATQHKSDIAIGIFCTRQSRQDASGVTVYDEGSVAIALLGDKYNFYWPKSQILPENIASQVQSSILQLRGAMAASNVQFNQLSDQLSKASTVVGYKGTNTPQSGISDTDAPNLPLSADFSNAYVTCPPGSFVSGIQYMGENLGPRPVAVDLRYECRSIK